MKVIRKPLISTFTLLALGSIVYFMTSSSSEKSLGKVTPISLQKDSFVPEQRVMDVGAILHTVPEIEDEINPEVIQRPKNGQQQQVQLIEYELEFTETPFMPKMANETLKAQLGNAAWKLFHTILARYPDKPNKQEKSTLAQYIQLFAQVYPCGDCARHFQKLLKKYPPQIGSRKTAALWGCDIHNKVNDRLNKPQYDCTTILEDYDCGCGSDEKEEDFTLGKDTMENVRKLEVEKEEIQRGG